MARLQQLHPGDYRTSSNISAEIENIVRYLNSAELGNRTLRELLEAIFDNAGRFDGPIQMRFDANRGLEVRIGEYPTDLEGWTTLASTAQLRGPAGTSVGEIDAGLFAQTAVAVATANQTVFPLASAATDQIFVHRNGLLQREGITFDYVRSDTAITFTAPQPANTVISMVRARGANESRFRQTIQFTTAPQVTFAYPSELIGQPIFVYRNGLLQREGSTSDYVRTANQNTLNFLSALPANDTVTIYGWVAQDSIPLTGVMLERNYADPATGMIQFSRVSVPDGAIPNSKVNGLPDFLAEGVRLHIGATPPTSPATVRFWLDTSTAPASLRVFDGAVWLRTTIENLIPPYTTQQSRQFLQVNALGDALVWGSVDLSSVIPRAWRGAANGVAALDGDGRLPTTQLPSIMPSDTIYWTRDGVIAGGVYPMKRIYGQRILITGFTGRLGGGTCTARLQIGGVDLGPSFTLSASPTETPFATPLEVDASTASRIISLNVTAPSTPSNIEIALATRNVF